MLNTDPFLPLYQWKVNSLLKLVGAGSVPGLLVQCTTLHLRDGDSIMCYQQHHQHHRQHHQAHHHQRPAPLHDQHWSITKRRNFDHQVFAEELCVMASSRVSLAMTVPQRAPVHQGGQENKVTFFSTRYFSVV